MSRRLLSFLTSSALAVSLLGAPAPDPSGSASVPAAPTRAEEWAAIGQRAADWVDVLTATGVHRAFTLAYAAQATAWLSPNGWADPKALAYLTRMRATQNPDGGYGLGVAYDAHQDGTVNPATTTYTVSLAGHVIPVLLDAYRNGAAPRAEVQQLLTLLAGVPRIDTVAGRCLAYSLNANDDQTGLCVHNVNAGAAALWLDAGRDGFAIPWWLVAGIAKRTASVYNLTTRFTPYRDSTAPASDDVDHASYTAESMLWLDPSIGYVAAYHIMLNDFTYAQTPLAHMRLVSATAVRDGASWCGLGDRWLAEADAFVTASSNDAVRMAQTAYYAARAAKVCA